MKRGIIALLSVALVFGQNANQRPPAAPPDDPSRITVDVTRVNLLYTVTDKKSASLHDHTERFSKLSRTKEAEVLFGVHRIRCPPSRS
jgi:hypothetical protein